MFGYIYKITNNVNGKIYIGQHRAQKFEPELYFGSGKLLLQAIKKYGKSNFTCELLVECDSQDELDSMEQLYIQHFNTLDLTVGYNLTAGGYGGGRLHVPQETREKIRAACAGRIVVNNGAEQHLIDPDDFEAYQSRGYVRGVLPFSRSELFKKKLSDSTTGKKGMYRITSDNEIETRWGYPEEFEKLLAAGWNFGWKPPVDKPQVTRKPRKQMFNGCLYQFVDIDDVDNFLKQGWICRGKPKGKPSWNAGKKMSSDLCAKLSKAHLGEKQSPERIKNHADSLRGRVYMNNGVKNKLIPRGEETTHINAGWKLGKISRKSS